MPVARWITVFAPWRARASASPSSRRPGHQAQAAVARRLGDGGGEAVGAAHHGGHRQPALDQLRHHAAADEAGAAEHHHLVRPRRAGLGQARRRRLRRLALDGLGGDRLAPVEHLGRLGAVDGQRAAGAQGVVEGLDRAAHAGEVGVHPAAQPEGEAGVAHDSGRRPPGERARAAPSGQEAVPELQPGGLLLARRRGCGRGRPRPSRPSPAPPGSSG